MSDAVEQNHKIYLNGYFKATLIGFAGFVITSLLFIASNVIANDTKYMTSINANTGDLREFKADIKSIKEDIEEIKNLLRRTSNGL